jgi:hypothetical protein
LALRLSKATKLKTFIETRCCKKCFEFNWYLHRHKRYGQGCAPLPQGPTYIGKGVTLPYK